MGITLPTTEYTSGTDGVLTSPSDTKNTSFSNLIPYSSSGNSGLDPMGSVAVFLGNYSWLTSVVIGGPPVEDDQQWFGLSTGNTYGGFSMLTSTYLRRFADSRYNGLRRFTFPKTASGDFTGGYGYYYYHDVYWAIALAVAGNPVFDQAGNTYRNSILPINLIVNNLGQAGPAALGIATAQPLTTMVWDSHVIGNYNLVLSWPVAGDHATITTTGKNITVPSYFQKYIVTGLSKNTSHPITIKVFDANNTELDSGFVNISTSNTILTSDAVGQHLVLTTKHQTEAFTGKEYPYPETSAVPPYNVNDLLANTDFRYLYWSYDPTKPISPGEVGSYFNYDGNNGGNYIRRYDATIDHSIAYPSDIPIIIIPKPDSDAQVEETGTNVPPFPSEQKLYFDLTEAYMPDGGTLPAQLVFETNGTKKMCQMKGKIVHSTITDFSPIYITTAAGNRYYKEAV